MPAASSTAVTRQPREERRGTSMPPVALYHVPVWLLIGLLVVWVLAQAAHWLLPPLLEWVKYLDQRRRHDDFHA